MVVPGPFTSHLVGVWRLCWATNYLDFLPTAAPQRLAGDHAPPRPYAPAFLETDLSPPAASHKLLAFRIRFGYRDYPRYVGPFYHGVS